MSSKSEKVVTDMGSCVHCGKQERVEGWALCSSCLRGQQDGWNQGVHGRAIDNLLKILMSELIEGETGTITLVVTKSLGKLKIEPSVRFHGQMIRAPREAKGIAREGGSAEQ